MRTFITAVIVSLIATFVSTAVAKPPTAKQTDLGQQVEANNRFALELYHQLATEKGDLFLSPYSISSAFAMTTAGAKNATAEQMANTMHFVLPGDRLHAAFGEMTQSLNSASNQGNFELRVANALWGQKDYKFRDEFLSLVKEQYGAGLNNVDFASNADTARQTINSWVEKQTNNRIKDLLKPGMVDSMTRLVLTNAIYFKGQWAEEFDKKDTIDEPFISLDGSTRDVPMMHQTKRFRYGEYGELKMLEMPYRGDRLSMVVLLPKENNGLTKLEQQLSTKNMASWLGKASTREVDVALPKFTMKRDFSLGKTLKAMGMTDAFIQGKADFSGMDGSRNLFIGTAVHQAFVEVNEEGTEAAAATGIVSRGSIAFTTPDPQFRADHPFIFMIRDTQTKAILFIGRVVSPKTPAK